MGRRVGKLAIAGIGVVLAVAPGAGAATLHANEAVDRSCAASQRPAAPGIAIHRITTPGTSTVSARLEGARGNWNLAVFEAGSNRLVAASSFAGGDEVAQGFALDAGTLVVQACRLTGSDPTARVAVDVQELTEPAPPLQMVRIATPGAAAEQALVASGIDLTEHGGPGYVDAVLHSGAEAERVRDLGLSYEVLDPNLLETSLAQRATERRAGGGGGLPSGRTGTYRRLFEYSEELQALAENNPRLVRYFTLPFETLDGRRVEGIEVAPRVRRKDGRPVFVLLGAHHAREWPSAEHTLEFAYELVNGWKQGNDRIRSLMRRARVVFVPVVNPDGFNVSREAGVGVADAGRDAPGGDETANLVVPYEYQRKNCRVVTPTVEDEANCMGAPMLGLTQFGVDPNRNYGGLWGGPGASTEDTMPFGATAQDYRGPGPFSEAETRNIRRLISRRQVVTMITNHTFSNLVLFPPGLQSYGPPVDDRALRRLGAAMARENGYADQAGYELYDTSGTTEDWSYNTTGGFGYTFEIGPTAFHPAFDAMVAEYRGTTETAGDGGGNRAAYLKALRATVKRKLHSVIRGTAPAGARLTLSKRFKTPTSPVIDGAGEEGDVIRLPELLKTTMRVPASGRFVWDVNPSTRPLVDPRRKLPTRRPGRPSDPVEFSGAPGPDAAPCADFDTEDPGCYNDHPFTVPGGEGIDNGTATVRISWPEPASDWDMKVFRDSDRDGSSEGETKLLGSSASGPSSSEETTIARPGLRRGKYVVRVINYAAASPYDGRVTFGKTKKSGVTLRNERWTLTCTVGGSVLARQKISVQRGGVARVALARACRS